MIETGVANVASVAAGLERAGASVRLTSAAGEAERAELLVLPGVGAFGAGMAGLRRLGMVEMLRERAESGRPLLAVCLGMQLLAEASRETPGERGLGVVAGEARPFGPGVRAVQMGWNMVEPTAGCRFLQRGHAYFANSFRLTEPPPGWSVAIAEHGGRFIAAMERGAVLACQFHPELSGAWGRALLERWVAQTREGAAC